MSFTFLMTLTAVVLGSLGIAFVVSLRWMMSFTRAKFPSYPKPKLLGGVEGDLVGALVGGIAMMRLLGMVLIGLGAYAWQSRHLVSVEAQANVVEGFFIINLLAFLMAWFHQRTTWGVLRGRKRVASWLVVTSFLLLAVTFGYIRFVRS